ncbi:hypothetical protein Godav_024819 [Gossypium davidsonii]|uniref:DC1 domain-containing protein n=1 Tax=Gossypium davidsonii TaxID=34287 RepID=A0A7J8T848_GOSDV|nr:hypothetical protein [Gossypium davidsonii]
MIDYQSGLTNCSRCGEKVSAPCFYCSEHCGFYLHKVCADAPLELNHPFHPHHPLVLLQEPPSSYTMRSLTMLPFNMISTKNGDEKLKDATKCFGCWEPLANDEVRTDHGSYYCSECEVIFHVKCTMKNKYSYKIVENEYEESADVSSITKVLEWNDAGEATLIEHIYRN